MDAVLTVFKKISEIADQVDTCCVMTPEFKRETLIKSIGPNLVQAAEDYANEYIPLATLALRVQTTYPSRVVAHRVLFQLLDYAESILE